jgi:hypothetical protein
MCSTGASSTLPPASRKQNRLERLEREIGELAGHLAAATCRWLSLVAEFDESGGWADWGAKSCAQWLSWRCSVGQVAAREHVRVARRLTELPLVREAFSSGELSYCKVRAITRVATPETEEELVQIGLHASGTQLEKVVRLFRGVLGVSRESAERVIERRSLTYAWNDDGSLAIQAQLPPDEGAVVLAALKAAEAESADPESENDSAEAPALGDRPSARRADALVSIARSSLADTARNSSDGDPCEVVVHVDMNSLPADRINERCELTDRPAIAPETARRLGCDASIVRILERDGRPLSVSRRKRTVPAALRRALRSRDDGCRFPGCAHRRFLHAHHIQHWARGGPTTLDNLIQLCSFHHRLVHEGGFLVEPGTEHRIRFRSPDGRLIPDASRPSPGHAGALVRQHRIRGPAINADTCRPRSMGDRIDYDLAILGLSASADP